jgi:hypothetical protein
LIGVIDGSSRKENKEIIIAWLDELKKELLRHFANGSRAIHK